MCKWIPHGPWTTLKPGRTFWDAGRQFGSTRTPVWSGKAGFSLRNRRNKDSCGSSRMTEHDTVLKLTKTLHSSTQALFVLPWKFPLAARNEGERAAKSNVRFMGGGAFSLWVRVQMKYICFTDLTVYRLQLSFSSSPLSPLLYYLYNIKNDPRIKHCLDTNYMLIKP